jgi:hypothetical protein
MFTEYIVAACVQILFYFFLRTVYHTKITGTHLIKICNIYLKRALYYSLEARLFLCNTYVLRYI